MQRRDLEAVLHGFSCLRVAYVLAMSGQRLFVERPFPGCLIVVVVYKIISYTNLLSFDIPHAGFMHPYGFKSWSIV